MRLLITLVTALVTVTVTTTAQAFCGFYVARADTSLFNRASQVVLVRDDDRTVITMANDFEGEVDDFAVVIPVPTMIEREQINVGDRAVIQHLDAYTSPRLVEYHDADPCALYDREEMLRSSDAALPESAKQMKRSARSRGVTIEAQYTVGEYDILILSATQSDGLIRWLNDNDYKIPRGAKKVVDSYLKQDMRFFVAKVNVEEQSKLGYQYLRPIQVAYESNKIHAADTAWHAERQREAGTLRLCTDTNRPRRDNKLPHGEIAEQCQRSGVCRWRVRGLLSSHV